MVAWGDGAASVFNKASICDFLCQCSAASDTVLCVYFSEVVVSPVCNLVVCCGDGWLPVVAGVRSWLMCVGRIVAVCCEC